MAKETDEGLGRTDVFLPDHLSASDVPYSTWSGRRLARKRHRQGYNALYLDWHVGYLQVEPENPEFPQQEINLWNVTK